MQQHGRFEEQIKFAEADGRRLAVGYASHAGEKVLNRDLPGGGVEDNLIRIVQAERDYIPIVQGPLGNSLAVDKNAELIAAILQKILAAIGENRRAVARNAAVGNCKLVSYFAAANRKRRLGDGHRPAGVFGRNDVENGFAECWGVWHRMIRSCDCTIIDDTARMAGAENP